MIEEIVSSWIVEDVHELNEQQERWEADPSDSDPSWDLDEIDVLDEPWDPSTLDEDDDDDETPAPTAKPKPPAKAGPKPAGTAALPGRAESPPATARKSAGVADDTPEPLAPVAPADERTAAAEPQGYPTSLTVEPDWPHLVVDSCSQKGVWLRFNARCLEHPGFRLSMPIACAFSNSRDRTDLVARPLAFHDQSQGAVRNAQEVEAGHEQRLREGQTPADLVGLLGRLEHLPTPFHLPMPYYVNTEHANAGMSLDCQTARRLEDKTTLCLILIPHPRYALAWLRNVNGVCGREYQLLARDAAVLWSDAWEGTSEEVRQRLGSWADFETGERFRFYVNDAEFGSKDEGLAGIVLTDRRLIYHRYHRNGAVNISDSPRVRIRPDGDSIAVTVRTDDTGVRAARIRQRDLDPFIGALGDVGLTPDVVAE